MTVITLPHAYEPRNYQLGPWKAFDNGIKRLLLIWHRRAGKDKTCLNIMARATQQRVGSYFYFYPTYNQARKALWEGMDGAGFRFMDHFPYELRQGDPNNTEMKVTLRNGSIFRLIGSDQIDSIMSTNPVGCVFSEYSLEDPAGWDFTRPILRENGGWALFNGTPRGKNHLYRLYNMAQTNPEWYVNKLTIEDTGVMSAADVELEIASGMSRELAMQEFYCSFEGGMEGAYYTQQLQQAERENRITNVPHDPEIPVDTWWDLGVGDSTAIVFVQIPHASEVRIIDYYETSGEGLPHYAHVLQTKGYLYGEHVAPHDIQVRDFTTGKTRLEAARALGINFKVAPKFPVDDGIDAVRRMLPITWIDREKCGQFLDAISSYRKEYDVKLQEFKARPLHDWTSHAADALRTGAVGRKRARVKPSPDRYARATYRQPRRTGGWMTM